jgi:hypothetical protein
MEGRFHVDSIIFGIFLTSTVANNFVDQIAWTLLRLVCSRVGFVRGETGDFPRHWFEICHPKGDIVIPRH